MNFDDQIPSAGAVNEFDREILTKSPGFSHSNTMMDEEIVQSNEPVAVDNRPLIVRIGDKNWKTRLSAYEDLKNELLAASDNSSVFEDYSSYLTKMTSDANAGALDAGLDTSITYVDKCPNFSLHVSSFADKLFSNVVDKTFSSKVLTLNRGKALLMKMMEVDEPTSCALYLISKLSDKKPKVPPTCLEIMKDGIVAFGARSFPINEIIASLAAVLNGSNGPAREIALALMIELTKWIGKAPFNSLLESLRTAQKSEFDKLFGELEAQGGLLSKPVPTLYLRKNRPAPGSVIADTNVSGKAAATADEGRDFIEEIDLAKRLKSTEFSNLVVEEKWSEQLKGLQLVVDALGPTPKIKVYSGSDAIVYEICAVIKGFLRQGHLQVQVISLKVLSLLSDGLRNEFTQVIKPLISLILSKSKEKRLVADVQSCLLQICKYCLTSLEVCMEDICELIKNKKNPSHARICVMELLSSIITTLNGDHIQNDHLKPIVDSLVSSCEDPDPKVRESCVITLSDVNKLLRKRPSKSVNEAVKLINALEQNIPKVYKKIQDSLTGQVVNNATATTKAAPASKLNASPSSKVKSMNMLTSTTGSASTTSAGTVKRASSVTTATKKINTVSGKTTSGSANNAAAAIDDDNVEDLTMSPEEAQQLLGQHLGIENWESEFQALMVSAKWQEKVDALTVLSQHVTNLSPVVAGTISTALITYLSHKTSSFKISNINIMKAVIQVSCDLAKKCSATAGSSGLNRAAAWELLKNFGDKLSDRKTTEVVVKLMTSLCEATSSSFVVKRMKVVMDKVKAPLAHQYYLEWLKQAVSEFGANSFPIPFIGSFCQVELDNKMASVRSAAVEVMGELFHQIGPRLQSIAFSDDMKPQVKALLEAEFAKVGYDPSILNSKQTAVKQKGSNVDEGLTIPRFDLIGGLDKSILTDLNFTDSKTSWQNRKAAMEAIIAACENSGHFVEFSKSLVELVKALKIRITDTQANLKPIAVCAIGHVITSIDTENAVKLLKLVGSGLLSGLSDNKKPMRDATVAALDMSVKPAAASGVTVSEAFIVLLPSISDVLSNPVGRQELLQWLVSHIDAIKLPDHSANSLDIFLSLAQSLLNCLQDKTAAVRSMAEQLMVGLAGKGSITKSMIEKITRDLSVATKRTLQATIDKLLLSTNSPKDIQINKELSSSKDITKELKDILTTTTKTSSALPRSSSLSNNASSKALNKSQDVLVKEEMKGIKVQESVEDDYAMDISIVDIYQNPSSSSGLIGVGPCVGDQYVGEPMDIDDGETTYEEIQTLTTDEDYTHINYSATNVNQFVSSTTSYDGSLSPFKLQMTPPRVASKYSNLPITQPIQQNTTASYSSSSGDLFNLDNIMTPLRANHELKSNDVRMYNNPMLVRSSIINQTPPNGTRASTAGTPSASTSIFSDSSTLPGIYVDILSKVDLYLNTFASINSSSVRVGEQDSYREQAIDYLKILHEIVMGKWSSNMISEASVNQNDMLINLCPSDVELIINRLVTCISHSFTHVPSTIKQANQVQLDINLLSVAMASLYQLIKQLSSLESSTSSKLNLSESCVLDIISTCLSQLVDSRLTSDSTYLPDESYRVTVDIIKALNMIILKVANDSNNGLVFQVILKILLMSSTSTISSKVSQPASRLLLHRLSNEVSKPNGTLFVLPSVDLKSLLIRLHEFYCDHPVPSLDNTDENSTSVDYSFRCGKTLLFEISKAIGVTNLLSQLNLLNSQNAIPQSSYIFKVIQKFNILNNDPALPPPEPELASDLSKQLVSVINEIASAHDKLVPIQKLYNIRNEHKISHIQLNEYLMKGISSAFRRYVLDTLAKLDNAEVVASPVQPPKPSPIFDRENMLSTSSSFNSKISKPSPSRSGLNQSTSNHNISNSGTAEEALRILEGIRSIKPSTNATHSTSGSSSVLSSVRRTTPSKNSSVGSSSIQAMSSPRAAIQDKVRGSLNTLALSMQLDSISGMASNFNTNLSSSQLSGLKSTTHDNVLSSNDDLDLSSRISRLKSFNRK